MARSVMEHQFSKVPQVEIPRSSFDRSHGLKTTFDAGKLIPVLVDEVLPGDTFNVKMTAFARMATPIHPVMDNLTMDSFFFFVPYRLIWDNWEKFNGAQDNPADSTSFVVPTMTSALGGTELGLWDYFGIPTKTTGPIEYSCLPFRAYSLIWNEWFRDQNLQNSVTVDTDDGPDTTSNYDVWDRNKRPDYFTSALPWPQKGDSVDLPLGTSAPVVAKSPWYPTFQNLAGSSTGVKLQSAAAYNAEWTVVGALGDMKWDAPALEANLSTATAATINDIREAFQVQRLLERDARGGTRYTEVIKAHFGVTSPDQRLQRPEYLGGGSTPINVTPVPQTSETGTSPQGNLAAFGTAGIQNHGFTKSFTEHGVIIGIVNVRADLTYQQGLERFWSRQTRYDFYWPSLAHLGEQEILSKEIFMDGVAADDDVFGYQERYAEYRYKPSRITGLFRSNATATLDPWHLSQEFSTRPTLNSTFITEDPPVDRVIAVPAEPHFLFDAYFSMRCARPMPLFGVPGLVDHF